MRTRTDLISGEDGWGTEPPEIDSDFDFVVPMSFGSMHAVTFSDVILESEGEYEEFFLTDQGPMIVWRRGLGKCKPILNLANAIAEMEAFYPGAPYSESILVVIRDYHSGEYDWKVMSAERFENDSYDMYELFRPH